jgi:hypothetical protein
MGRSSTMAYAKWCPAAFIPAGITSLFAHSVLTSNGACEACLVLEVDLAYPLYKESAMRR